jgi:hypothetical protein
MTARYQAEAAVAPALGVAIQALAVREPDDFEGLRGGPARRAAAVILKLPAHLDLRY